MNKIKLICLSCFFVLCLFFSGCAPLTPRESHTAEQLFTIAAAKFEEQDYQQAIVFFEKIKDWHPFSKHALEAEIKIADSYYELEKYEESLFSYNSFAELHPAHKFIPYVIYRMGMCYFQRIDTVDRDQTPARKAYEIFLRLKMQFPDSEYAKKNQRAC